jgi:hypothetical protein
MEMSGAIRETAEMSLFILLFLLVIGIWVCLWVPPAF